MSDELENNTAEKDRDDGPVAKREPSPVGYRNPPEHSRFQKGRSRNPKGRPKREESCRDLMKEELDALISVQENGKTITLSKRKAWVKSVVNGAIMGNPKDEKILMIFEKPGEGPPRGGGMRIIVADSEDEIPAK